MDEHRRTFIQRHLTSDPEETAPSRRTGHYAVGEYVRLRESEATVPGKFKGEKKKKRKTQTRPKGRIFLGCEKGLIGPGILILDSLTQTLICFNPSFGERG